MPPPPLDPAEMVPASRLRDAQRQLSQAETRLAELRAENARLRAQIMRGDEVTELIASGGRIAPTGCRDELRFGAVRYSSRDWPARHLHGAREGFPGHRATPCRRPRRRPPDDLEALILALDERVIETSATRPPSRPRPRWRQDGVPWLAQRDQGRNPRCQGDPACAGLGAEGGRGRTWEPLPAAGDCGLEGRRRHRPCNPGRCQRSAPRCGSRGGRPSGGGMPGEWIDPPTRQRSSPLCAEPPCAPCGVGSGRSCSCLGRRGAAR